MIHEDQKQQLLEEFSSFIEDLSTHQPTTSGDNTVDLFTLCKEFIALKTEVKQESRQFKLALDSFREVFNTLQQSHDILSRELTERRQEQAGEIEKQKHILLKSLLLDIIELRDRLEHNATQTNINRPNWLFRLFKSGMEFIASIREGQAITLRRVDQLLSNYDVKMISTLHQPFNPEQMKAIDVDNQPELPQGVVTEELTKAFFWKNEILRIAEVKVNKQAEG